MKKSKILYHGSDKIIDKPLLGKGSPEMDYGSGFYTTIDIEWGKAWSQMYGKDKECYCNEYQLDITNLKILDLNQYGPIVWIAELLYNRGISSEKTEETANFIIDIYKINTDNADIIIGSRAIGCYPMIINSFLNNEISLNETIYLFQKGNMTNQWFIKSQKAFDQLSYIGYDKIIEEHPYLKEDTIHTKEVHEFLIQRKRNIEKGIYKPKGIFAIDLVNNYFTYDKDTGFCYISDYEEMEEPDYGYDDK